MTNLPESMGQTKFSRYRFDKKCRMDNREEIKKQGWKFVMFVTQELFPPVTFGDLRPELKADGIRLIRAAIQASFPEAEPLISDEEICETVANWCLIPE